MATVWLIRTFTRGPSRALAWLGGWKRAGWKTADKKPVKNQDLWQELDRLMQTHTVRFHWVPGHSGHPENERCDRLACTARDSFRGGGRGPTPLSADRR